MEHTLHTSRRPHTRRSSLPPGTRSHIWKLTRKQPPSGSIMAFQAGERYISWTLPPRHPRMSGRPLWDFGSETQPPLAYPSLKEFNF